MVPCGSLWVPCGFLVVGSLLVPCGSLLVPCGSLLVPCGSLWAPRGFLVGSLWVLLVQLICHWFLLVSLAVPLVLVVSKTTKLVPHTTRDDGPPRAGAMTGDGLASHTIYGTGEEGVKRGIVAKQRFTRRGSGKSEKLLCCFSSSKQVLA